MLLNLTPHVVSIFTDGKTIDVPPSGSIARVTTNDVPREPFNGIPTVSPLLGDVTGMPDDDIPVLVSMMVIDALRREKSTRVNVFAPDSGKTCIRNNDGHIQAVTRLIRI